MKSIKRHSTEFEGELRKSLFVSTELISQLESVNDLQLQFFYYSLLEKKRKVDLIDAEKFYHFIPCLGQGRAWIFWPVWFKRFCELPVKIVLKRIKEHSKRLLKIRGNKFVSMTSWTMIVKKSTEICV